MATEQRTPHRSIRLSGAILGLSLVAGCATGGRHAPIDSVVPPNGWFFASFKAPLTIEFNGNPTGPAIKHVEERQVHYFRDFLFTGLSFAWDSATIEKIAREGGIERVSYADYEYMHFLSIFAVTTIRVYGT
jgi:TRL-like protein family